MPPKRNIPQNRVSDKKTERTPTPYGRNRPANQASTSKTLSTTSAKKASTSTSRGSTTAKQPSTSKTTNHVITFKEASPSPDFSLEVNCVVEGELSSFSVPIHSSNNINALKDAIKNKKDPELNHIAADRLILRLIPDGGIDEERLGKLDHESLE
ncbi:hypothetical protein BGZ46_001843, partial [Entomortierella lignicola]